MAERRRTLGLQTKIVATILVLTAVPLILVWANSLRVLNQVGDELLAGADEARVIALSSSEKAVEGMILSSLAERARYVSGRIESYFGDEPAGEFAWDREDLRLRAMAIEPIGTRGFTMLYNLEGVVIVHPDRAQEGVTLESFARKRAGLLPLMRNGMRKPVSGEFREPEGDEPRVWLMAATPVEELSLVVAAVMPRDDWLGPLNRIVTSNLTELSWSLVDAVESSRKQLRIQSFLFFVLITMIVMLIGRRLAAQISRPIRELTRVVRELGAGEIRTLVGVTQRDEIGELARAFVQMKRDIKLYREQIEEKQRELSAANDEIRLFNQDLERRIRERTRELEIALEELKSLDKNKDDFIALVSHELRTPLTSIMATADALRGGDVGQRPADREALLEIIHDETNRLSRLITDVLQIQRMEAGMMPFEFRTVNLVSLIQKATMSMREAAKQKGVRIHVDRGGDARVRSVRADYDRIVQVVINLLSNAVKFTPKNGDVFIGLTVVSEAANGVQREFARISVEDTGPGIDPGKADKVFDKFFQAELIDHHSEGSGLGLPIAKQIVESHEGRIWFDSKLGEGSTFRFVLPLEGN